MLLCGLGGGEGSVSSSCPGILAVCCHAPGLRPPPPELSRVARTLSSPRRRKRPRKPKKKKKKAMPASHRDAPVTRRPVFLPHTSPSSHQITLATRAPAYKPGEGGRLAKLYSTGRPYYGPKKKIVSHATAPTQRPPVLIPELGGILPKPALGGPLIPPALGGPLDIPAIGGPLLTPAPQFRPLIRRQRKNLPFTAFDSNEVRPQSKKLPLTSLFTAFETNEIENNSPSPRKTECGLSTPASQSRILGGTDAGYGQFPWTAMISITGAGLDKMCAGSLVENRYILTAGHCVRYCEPSTLPNCTRRVPFAQLTFKVTIGEYDFQDKSKTGEVQRFHATEVFLHPDYTNVYRLRDSGFLESEPRNDVAVLKLDRQVKSSPVTGSICLPSHDLWLGAGTLATVVGWGRMGVHEGAPHSSVLQAVTVPVLTREECLEEPGASPPSSDQLCAGLSHARETSCPGDSGGGLMVRDESGIWTLIGIVSTGPAECGLTPVIYHDVRSSLDWISEIVHLSGA